MKPAPAWIHTGLNIPPRLASFLKKWGFTRDSAHAMNDKENSLFVAIVKGKAFDFIFMKAEPYKLCVSCGNYQDPLIFAEHNIHELEKFMRDHSQLKG